MFPTLLLTFSILSAQAAATSSITWLAPQRSAIVKLSTPSYPLWVMDKANAPPLYRHAENYYWETPNPSAILLNLTMSSDNKALLLNGEAILPLRDSNIPPRLTAYQVPANVTERNVKSLAEMGLLRGDWEEITLAYRFLELDYDRLVWADPAAGPWQNNVPTLRFRVMGIGAHTQNAVLDVEKQRVLHVTLTDMNHRSSDSPKRAYAISNIEIKSVEESYGYIHPNPQFDEDAECTSKSWRCPDKGLYGEGGAPYYRFIWRSKFDEFGRIGSGRHTVVKKLNVLKEVWEDAGPAMLLSFGILVGVALVAIGSVKAWQRWGGRRERVVRGLAEDDSLLGEHVVEKYTDEDVESTPVVSNQEPIRRLIDIPSEDEDGTQL